MCNQTWKSFNIENFNGTVTLSHYQLCHQLANWSWILLFLHQCLKLGEDAYQNFYKIWFIDKTKRLFDTMRKMKTSKGWRPTIQAYDLTLLWHGSRLDRNHLTDLQGKLMYWLLYDRDLCQSRVKDIVSFISYIECARSWSYELKHLLQFELTSNLVFLRKDGYLR